MVEMVTANGDCLWREPLLIDLDFGVLDPEVTQNVDGTSTGKHGGTLLLFEILQHPPSMKTWRKNRNMFADGVHRVAWAFLDVTAEIRTAMTQPLQLQLFKCV